MTRTRIATAAFIAVTAGLLSGAGVAAAAPSESVPSENSAAVSQLDRFDRAFAKIDSDGSGSIDARDVESWQYRWYYELNVAPHSAEGREIDSRARDLWREVQRRADTNRDHEVSRWESGALAHGASFVDRVVLPFSLAAFDVSDRNDDGRLSQYELWAVQSEAGATDAEIRAGFRQLDDDRNGYVQRSEFASAVHNVYLHHHADRAMARLVSNFL